MNIRRMIVLLLFCALLLPGAALAAGDDPIPGEDRFGGKDWDTVMEEFLAANNVKSDRVGIAYYNTVTGEEHFINGERYRFAASVYKLPLNMYYGERIYLGKMTMEDTINGWPYETIQKLSIEESNNELSEMLQKSIGSWDAYKAEIVHLIADDPSEIDIKETAPPWHSVFTPRQILHALKLLYADPDR